MLTPRIFLLTTLWLTGCSAPVKAISDYVQFKRGSSQAAVAQTQLNPAYKYLLVTVGGKSFLMARGGIERAPGGPIEVWYSGNREVLRIQNGRILSAAGTPVEWSDVRFSGEPAWEKIQSPVSFNRRRDVMPGYHFGLEDSLTVTATDAPSSSAFVGKVPVGLHWFIERSSGLYALPPARYAVRFQGDQAEVVYGEQCLSGNLCFSWQRWPT